MPSAISHQPCQTENIVLHPDRVYMLAADHRWQWEEFCDARSIPPTRIADVKRLALDAFLMARDRLAAVREFGALLVDQQYASAVIADALKAGVSVGTPAEKAGAFPLAWSTDSFADALTGAVLRNSSSKNSSSKSKSRNKTSSSKSESSEKWSKARSKSNNAFSSNNSRMRVPIANARPRTRPR